MLIVVLCDDHAPAITTTTTTTVDTQFVYTWLAPMAFFVSTGRSYYRFTWQVSTFLDNFI